MQANSHSTAAAVHSQGPKRIATEGTENRESNIEGNPTNSTSNSLVYLTYAKFPFVQES
jgi:hypothetical protein